MSVSLFFKNSYALQRNVFLDIGFPGFPGIPIKIEVFCEERIFVPVENFSQKKDGCAICQEEDEKPIDCTFCGNHWYHQSCTSKWGVKKLTELFFEKVDYRGLFCEWREVRSFSLKIPREALPNCPECRSCPETTFKITVTDLTVTGRIRAQASINAVIVDSPLTEEQIPLTTRLREPALSTSDSNEERQILSRGEALGRRNEFLGRRPPVLPPRPALIFQTPAPPAAQGAPFDHLNEFREACDKFYTVYNVAQAGLSYLQKYHELAAMIFKIQKVLIVVDIIGLGCTVYSLYGSIRKKMHNVSAKKMVVLSIISAVALAAISYGAVLGIQTYFKPSFNPAEILSGLDISAEKLKGINLSWDAPFIQTAMQCLYVSRIVATFTSVFFSKNPKLCMVSALSQTFSLFRISQLRWLKLEQTLEGGFPAFWSWEGLTTNRIQLKHVITKATCMIHPSCTKEASHLQAAVQSIYKYVDTLFKKESLKPYWRVRFRDGIEVGRTLYYEVVVSGHAPDPCACTLPIKLVELTMKAVDIYHGATRVEIAYSAAS